MRRHILVLHFSGQCPWYLWVIKQAEEAARELGARVETYDITNHPDLAEEYRMFFPFMTVINGRIRVPSPVEAKKLVRLAEEITEPEDAPVLTWGRRTNRLTINALTSANIQATIPLCIAGVRPIAGPEKVCWARSLEKKSGGASLGFIALKEGKAVGAVEYLPSVLVPYPLPHKSPSIAFISCIYPCVPDVDNRSPLLSELLNYLKGKGFQQLHVVAGRKTPFPNGPVLFFKQLGFVELEEIDEINLIEGKEKLVLMSKTIG